MKTDVKILLVEDEVVAAMMFQSDFKKRGFLNTKFVTTGEKAIAYVRDNPPDIILMDIHLARNLDGIETARTIKSFIEIPIVFMTGYDDQATRERAAEIKPLAFLSKPVNFEVIFELLENYFSGSEAL